MQETKTLLDYAYAHERERSSHRILVQPVGGGRIVEYSWSAMMDQARRMAAHLAGREGARIAILSKNCAHFFMAELAIWMAGRTTVAIAPTETAENLRYVLDHCEASLLFVGKLDDWQRQAQAVPPALPRVAFPLAPPAAGESWDAIAARTEPLSGHPARAADDLSMILYTSGSTGQPKGVMQSFRAITRVSEHLTADMAEWMPGEVEARILSYLPLSHAYERAAGECRFLCDGRGRVFFSESTDTFIDDIRRARPTLFCSVPRLWLKLQQALLQRVPAVARETLREAPERAPLLCRELLAAVGLDETRAAFSGSAPLPQALWNWWRGLGLNLLEGYAMTEDFCYSHVSTADKKAAGCVGPPRKHVQVRIGEGGELLIKSPGRFVGYYKRPDLDAQSFTEDGFFRTGDTGEYGPDGLLKITGRLKEPFKTAKGKYVAPAPIESRLNAHPLVELSMVSGVGQPAPFAAVMIPEACIADLDDPARREPAMAELRRLLRRINDELASHERLCMLVAIRERWSIDNGCLTSTLKIRRAGIEARLAPRIEAWYAEGAELVWAD